MRRRVSGWAVVGVVAGLVASGAVADGEAAPGEVLVVATRTEESLRDVPASVQIIDAAAVGTANPINVEELFRHVVGVDLQGSGFPGSAIRLNMRGLTPGYQTKRVLVLVDGRRFNDQYQGNAEMALLPADGIERIEVLRGPASALYGSNAMAGVINIVTRRGSKDPSSFLKVAGGTHDTWHVQADHGWAQGVVDYFVNGSTVVTDGYMQNSDGTNRDWEALNLAGNVGWTLNENSTLRLYLGHYSGEGTDENSERTVEKDYQNLEYTLLWDEQRDARLQARLYRNGDQFEYDWKFPGKGIYDQETLAGEVQQTLWLSDANRGTVGLELRRESVDIREVTGPIDEYSSVLGVFAQDEVLVSERFRLTAGLRYDDARDYDSEWSPRLGMVWRAGEDADVFASANRAYRAPGLSDRFVQTEFNGMLFVGNPDLQPETLTAAEAGARYRFGPGRIELAVFHNTMDDSFDFMLDPDGVFRIRNVTKVMTYGVEADLRYDVTDEISTFVQYSFTHGEYDEFGANPAAEGNQLAYLAPNKAAAGVDYRAGKMGQHTLRARYVDRRYGDAQNTDANTMEDYIVADWRTRVPVHDRVQLTLNVDNIFDETYQDFPGLDQPGRIVMLGAEVVF